MIIYTEHTDSTDRLSYAKIMSPKVTHIYIYIYIYGKCIILLNFPSFLYQVQKSFKWNSSPRCFLHGYVRASGMLQSKHQVELGTLVSRKKKKKFIFAFLLMFLSSILISSLYIDQIFPMILSLTIKT